MSRRNSCLTCRTRKAKCDRLLPRCSTCSRLNCPCLTPERNTELVWLRPEVNRPLGQDIATQDARPDRGLSSRARRYPILSGEECGRHIAQMVSFTTDTSVNAVLDQIDAESNYVGDSIFSRGPFGVFQLPNTREDPRGVGESASVGSCSLDDLDQGEISNLAKNALIDNYSPLPVVDEQDLLLTQQESYPEANPASDLWENPQELLQDSHQDLLPEDHRALLQEDYQPFSEEAIASLPDPIPSNNEFSIASITSMPTAYVSDISDLDFHSTRVLLDSYRNTLVPCFLPVQRYELSPWEFLHIPKVHEALGEALVRGNTSHAKSSLLFAVLSASAFHLHMQSRHSALPDQPWRAHGEEYRARAKKRLVLSLENHAAAQSHEDFLDILLALTSMFTVSVVSGDIDEAYVYLREVVSRLNATDGMERSRICANVQILQNIFFYIRTLQNSVGVYSGESLVQGPSVHMQSLSTTDSFSTNTNQAADRWHLSSEVDECSALRELPPRRNPCSCNPSQSIFEQIFSLPVSLFDLISRVTILIHEVEQFQQCNSQSPEAGYTPLSCRISQLEIDIWNWNKHLVSSEKNSPVREFLYRSPCSHLGTATSEAEQLSSQSPLRNFMEAMQSALLVLFYRCVRKVDTLMIQHLVDKTIQSLLRCTDSRQRSNDPSSNICWPLFIAGSEALNLATRRQVGKLLNGEVARTGMRMFEVAAQAINAVWSARDQENNRNLSWSKVLQEYSMLTRLTIS